jgi:aminopeptidase YwaD
MPGPGQARVATFLLAAAAVWAAPPPFTADDPGGFLEHVEFLAAPEMKGRGAGSPELDQAAEYIAKQFESAGLQPAGDDGSYFQKFAVTTGAKMGTDNRLEVTRNRGVDKLAPGEEYIPINFSSSGEVSGQAVFAGYGVSADELDYDDYTHFDVKDKIVIVLRYEPDFFEDDDERGKRGRRRRYTRHSHLISKAINARDRGAKALILVEGPGRRADSLIKFGSISGPADAGIPVVQVKSSVVEKWLRGSGRSLRILRRDINGKHEPQSFELAESLTIELGVDVEREQAMVSNVAGYLPGETDEFVVFGAHYDHLGLGDQSSLAPSQIGDIHHGADDNASGTAGLIELAGHYASGGEKPRRGLLFLAFAAEEIGLLGSRHWVENPTLPIEDAVSMLNMDMVGRIDNGKIYVGGIGTAEPFEEMLNDVKDDYSFKVDVSRSGYSASDHTSFVGKKIPVMFFFSGLHSDYHKPSDTVDKINSESAVELLSLVSELANGVIDAEARPAFIDGSPESGHGPVSSAGGGGGGYGPWFGSIPDFGEVPEGVKFADIRAGSPAETAGLKAGDILIGWNDKAIKNLYDFTYALRDSAVGDVVKVRVLRDGAEQTADVKLMPRP